MPAAEAGKRRVCFDFFVVLHASTMSAFTRTAQRANITSCASSLNYVVSFEFVRRKVVDCLNRRVGDFFELLFASRLVIIWYLICNGGRVGNG